MATQANDKMLFASPLSNEEIDSILENVTVDAGAAQSPWCPDCAIKGISHFFYTECDKPLARRVWHGEVKSMWS